MAYVRCGRCGRCALCGVCSQLRQLLPLLLVRVVVVVVVVVTNRFRLGCCFANHSIWHIEAKKPLQYLSQSLLRHVIHRGKKTLPTLLGEQVLLEWRMVRVEIGGAFLRPGLDFPEA